MSGEPKEASSKGENLRSKRGCPRHEVEVARSKEKREAASKRSEERQRQTEAIDDVTMDSGESDSNAFNFLQSNVGGWIRRADDLVKVAEKLETDRDAKDNRFIISQFNNVYNMLVGFALENYYKGAILADRKKEGHIQADKLQPEIKKHDLQKLASEAGIVVSRLHENYLGYITDCVVWRGRYPLPSEATDLRGSMVFHPADKDRGERLSHLVCIEHAIPIDSVHELLNQARSNAVAKVDSLRKAKS